MRLQSKTGKTKKRKTRKRRHTSSSSQSCSPPRRRKKRSKKESKKKRRKISPSSTSSLSPSHSSSSESEEEDHVTKRFHIPPVVKGRRMPFITIPFQQKNSNFTGMNQNQIALVDLEIEMLRKGTIKKTQPAQGDFFVELIPCREKRWRLSPCNQSKTVQPVCSFSPFENRRPASFKAHNTGGRLDVQTGPKRCILQCPIRGSS